MHPHPMHPDIRWIAPPDRRLRDPLPIEICYFKCVPELSEVPERCAVTVSANSRFCLYVNGTAVLDGPCRGDEWRHYCEHIDIAPWLRRGKNCVAAKVCAYPAFGSVAEDYGNAGPHSVIGNSYGPMLYLEADDALFPLSTGKAGWHCMTDTATAWTVERIPLLAGGNETVDGALVPHGWEQNTELAEGFLSAVPRWDNCPRCGELSPLPLHERPIPPALRVPLPAPPPLAGCRQDAAFPGASGTPLHVPPNTRWELTLDNGRLTTAFLDLVVEGGSGSLIRIGYAEAFGQRDESVWMKKGRRDDATGEFLGIWDEYRPGGGHERYRPFWFRTFRFLRLAVETGGEGLALYPPALTETRYPLEDTLRFSLPALPWAEPVYEICLRTLQLCMHDTYEDCPFYEQLQYAMDTRLQMLFTYAVSCDTRMALRTIDDFHRSLLPEGIGQARYPGGYRQVIPLFSLHWVLMLLDYHEHTGDTGVLERYRPSVEQVLHWFREKTGPQGMIEGLGHWEFVDWTTEWNPRGGVPDAVYEGPCAVNNFFYAYVLGRAAELFGALGLHHQAAAYRAEGTAVRERTAQLCWDNGRQLFREGPRCTQFSQHTQIYAVLCGAVEGAAAGAVMRKSLAEPGLVQCSFVMQFYLFRALEASGLYAETWLLWARWRKLLELNATTVPEVPGPFTRSDCHAWGALPLYELPRCVFGVTPLEPGYGSVSIAPCLPEAGDFDAWVPIPQGTVELHGRWSAGRLALTGNTPVPALVLLPHGGRYRFPAGEFAAE